jgi:lysophospholipase L1-like esterase
MADRVREAGLPVLVANILPVNRPYPGIQPKITQLNRLIDGLGVTVVDFHRVLEKPAGSGRLPPAWEADGLHPSVEGYRRLGGAVASSVAAVR